LKHKSSLSSITNVQTRLTSDEYDRLCKFAQARNVSLNLAVRGIIESTINKSASLPLDTALSSDEKKILTRFLDLYRSGDADVIRCLQGIAACMEKIPFRSSK
jgi:hypothetical protein